MLGEKLGLEGGLSLNGWLSFMITVGLSSKCLDATGTQRAGALWSGSRRPIGHGDLPMDQMVGSQFNGHGRVAIYGACT